MEARAGDSAPGEFAADGVETGRLVTGLEARIGPEFRQIGRELLLGLAQRRHPLADLGDAGTDRAAYRSLYAALQTAGIAPTISENTPRSTESTAARAATSPMSMPDRATSITWPR